MLTKRRFLCADIEPNMVAMSRRRVGLPSVEQDAPPAVPRCPVFRVTPPDISLWGLHPEDVCSVIGRDECENVDEHTQYSLGMYPDEGAVLTAKFGHSCSK